MSDNEKKVSTINRIVTVAAGFGAIVGTFFFVRKQVRNARAARFEKLSAEETNPAFFAKRFHMAFHNDTWFGMGTDEHLIRAAMKAVPSKDFFNETQKAYAALYNGNQLMADLESELSSTEFSEIMAILNAKPQREGMPVDNDVIYRAWAKRLKAAFDIKYAGFPGTDEDAIKAVFIEMPTQRAFAEVAKVYFQDYGNYLLSDLKSELEFWEFNPMMKIITDKPKG
jgi:hypothetical protein